MLVLKKRGKSLSRECEVSVMKLYLFNGSAHYKGNADYIWRMFENEARTKRNHTIHYNKETPSHSSKPYWNILLSMEHFPFTAHIPQFMQGDGVSLL